MIVAVDGPAAAGKSTAARKLASALGIGVLDSGALYRAAAWKMAQSGASDSDARARILRRTRIRFVPRTDEVRILVDGEDVTRRIRTPEIARASSVLAASADVRRLVAEALRGMASDGDFVVEGRDIGTVVFPAAEAKFFLDAPLAVRARRRAAEQATGEEAPRRHERVRGEIEERDARDRGRDVAPLRPAHDAVTIDTGGLTADEVVTRMRGELARRGLPGGPKARTAAVERGQLEPEALLSAEPGEPEYFRVGALGAAAYTLGYWMSWAVVRTYFRGRIEGAGHIPRRGPLLVASNHACAIDPWLVGVGARARRLRFMAKAELFAVPLLGPAIRRLGAFPVRRGQRDTEAIRTALWILTRGGADPALLMFPEGTRSLDGKLGPARAGIGRLLHWTGAQVVPAYVEGSFDALPKGSRFPHPVRITVRFGAPVDYADLRRRPRARESYQAIADRVMKAIEAIASRR